MHTYLQSSYRHLEPILRTGEQVIRVVALMVFVYYASRFFMDVNVFIHAVYSATRVSTFIPYPIVAGALGLVAVMGTFFAAAALKDVGKGMEWVIIFLPMSALPFVLLGVPLAALNAVFICRASLNLLACLLFLKWFLKSVTLGRTIIRLPLALPIVMLFCVYLTNLIFVESDLRFSVFKSCVIFLSCAMFFYLVVNTVRDQKTLIRIFEIMVIACIIQILLSSLNFFYYLFILHRADYRLDGMIRDYELFAEYQALHIPLFIFLLRHPGTILSSKALKVFLTVLFFTLFATATRGAIIALVVGLIYYTWKIRRSVSLGKVLVQLLIWIIIAGTCLFILYQVFPPSAQIIERFTASDISKLDTRQAIWIRTWQYFEEKPLTGVGLVYCLAQDLFWPHSTYLFYLLTMGIPGLAAYVILLGAILFKGWQSERLAGHRGPVAGEIVIVMNTLLILFVIDSTKIEYMRYPNYQMFVWLLFALIVAVNEMLRRPWKGPHENSLNQ